MITITQIHHKFYNDMNMYIYILEISFTQGVEYMYILLFFYILSNFYNFILYFVFTSINLIRLIFLINNLTIKLHIN